MKVICIDDEFTDRPITYGKIYDVEEDEVWYRVLDDSGRISSYYKWRFKSIEELRDDKLKEIGI